MKSKKQSVKFKPAKYAILVRTHRAKHFLTFGFDTAKDAKGFLKQAITEGGCEGYFYRLAK